MKWLRWRFSSKEKDAMQNPRDGELYRGNLGLSPSSKKREINVRILYPRSKATELSVADVLAILITVCLERVKEEEKGKDDRLFINDVRIDRKGRSTEKDIRDDIYNESCFVIIILSNDMLHSPHSTFEEELKHVLMAREEKKSEKMFLLITTCNRDQLKCQNKETMDMIFRHITQGETVLSSGLSTTWVKNVIYEKYIKI